MLRLILMVTVYSASCMEMKETVERMVMVRTTGSDLQPAATGFIYKQNSDGPVKVIKMGESEILEQLKKLPEKLYEQPKAFAAPIPVAAGPFYAKEDESKAASQASESYVIPVVEEAENDTHDHVDDKVDGIADEDYRKIFAEYASKFDDYKGDYGDFPHDFGYDHHSDEHGDGSEYGAEGHSAKGDKAHQGYASSHHYGKGGAGDYHSEKHETFSVSGGGGNEKEYDEADGYGSDYAKGGGYKGGDHGHKTEHSKGEETDGYHKLFAKDEFKKDHDFYDGEALKGGFGKFGHGHSYHGSDAGGFKKGGSHESGHHKGGFGKSGFHDAESVDEEHRAHSGEAGDDSYHHHHGDFGSDGGHHGGKGYGYHIEHR